MLRTLQKNLMVALELDIKNETIIYFDYCIDSDNLIALTTILGWEHRNDVVFDQHTDLIHSISIGFRLEF